MPVEKDQEVAFAGSKKFLFNPLPHPLFRSYILRLAQITSKAVARDTPPPPQRVARPNVFPRFFMA
jgi:hypothetical protein